MDKKIGVINGLRGYAILAIIYHHLFYGWLIGPGWNAINLGDIVLLPFSFLSNGWLGVNLFFIVSGFVLFLPYARGTKSFHGKSDFYSFYIKRARRLLPLYYLSVLFFTIYLVREHDIRNLLSSLFFMFSVTFNFTKLTFFPRCNWVLWALGIMIWFSIIFPFIVILSKKIGIVRTFVLSLVVSLVVRYIGLQDIFLGVNPYLNVMKDSLLGRLDDFILGMLICHIYCNSYEVFGRFISPALIFAVGVVFIMLSCSCWDYVVLGMFNKSVIPLINNLVQIGVFSIVMSLLYMKRGFVKYLFENYFIQLTGAMSYSLYVWHGQAIGAILYGNYNLANLAVYFLLLFLLSLFSYRFIEYGNVSDMKRLFSFQ